VARYDKVHFIVRAPAGTAIATGGVVRTVKLNAGGSVVYAGTADALGVVVNAGTIAAGHTIGILLKGEIIEFGGVAGVGYYAQASGSVGTANPTTDTKVGFTVEADRLVVNM
jgi:hypothetical protein